MSGRLHRFSQWLGLTPEASLESERNEIGTPRQRAKCANFGSRPPIDVIDMRPLGARLGQWYVRVEHNGEKLTEYPIGEDVASALDTFRDLIEKSDGAGHRGYSYRLYTPDDRQAMAVCW